MNAVSPRSASPPAFHDLLSSDTDETAIKLLLSLGLTFIDPPFIVKSLVKLEVRAYDQ